MECIESTQVRQLKAVKHQILLLGAQSQLEEIQKHSPYSAKITQHISQYEELRLYCDLQLQESSITRPALIRDIDFDLWVSCESCTNLELMKKGNAPYLFDSPDGRMEIHHIGQTYDSPFAELTAAEHSENSQLLHISREEGWRNEKALETEFNKERSTYWRKRSRQNYEITDLQFDPLPASHFQRHQDYLAELRDICEAIYMQCEEDDLDYLADLANSYAMMSRIGTTSMSDFIKKEKPEGIHCTACKSTKYVLHGTYQTRSETIQRYKCRSCGKIFSPLNKCLVSGSSFSFRGWIKFIDCLYNGYTIKQIAEACDISEHTAHENRTKLFYALKLLNDQVQLRGNVVLDETYLPVSYKGNHINQEDFVMPREANERGGENHKQGLSKNHVCIICAVDDCGNSVAKVAGVGITSALKLEYVLKEHLSEDIFCLYSDKSHVLRKFASLCCLEIKQEKLLKKGGKRAANVTYTKDTFIVNRYLQVINNYHSRLKKFLSRFSGISTKYLSGYLYLFAWKERSKNQEPEEAYKQLLHIMTAPNLYLSIEDIVKDGHIPNAVSIDERYRKCAISSERDKKIYRRYASGETMSAIAADCGITKQRVSKIIQGLRKSGYAYRTKWDIERENAETASLKPPTNREAQNVLKRNYQICTEKEHWTGTADEFNEAMSAKYGISKQTVKNVVTLMKRVFRLKEEIFIYENVSYQTQQEVYQSVYSDYLSLKAAEPNKSAESCARQLAPKYGFDFKNIIRIIQIMSSNTSEEYFSRKRKLTKTETYNRDKALFIDFLRWTGTRADFYCYASEKYGILQSTASHIITFCLQAEPTRYDQI